MAIKVTAKKKFWAFKALADNKNHLWVSISSFELLKLSCDIIDRNICANIEFKVIFKGVSY